MNCQVEYGWGKLWEQTKPRRWHKLISRGEDKIEDFLSYDF